MKLQEGDKAPAFSGKDQNGKTISLKDLKGSKVVVYFYPEDDTPTCTIQACNLRDNYSALRSAGFRVIGISPDDEKKHKKFEEKFDLPFTLIADPSHKILEKYGVRGVPGRRRAALHRGGHGGSDLESGCAGKPGAVLSAGEPGSSGASRPGGRPVCDRSPGRCGGVECAAEPLHAIDRDGAGWSDHAGDWRPGGTQRWSRGDSPVW